MSLYAFLAIGTVLMIGVMLIANRAYRVPKLRVVVGAVLLTVAGFAGAKLMAFIEMGDWSGKSFFGALFFAPVVMIPVSLALKVRWRDMLDLCAPAECVMLALLKVQCLTDGCCYGRPLRLDATGHLVRFPSQAVECGCALALMLLLLFMIHRGWGRGRLYAWYMLLYGVSRFFLNLLRETIPFVWILPAGNFWAMISAAIGLCAILFLSPGRAERRRQIA